MSENLRPQEGQGLAYILQYIGRLPFMMRLRHRFYPDSLEPAERPAMGTVEDITLRAAAAVRDTQRANSRWELRAHPERRHPTASPEGSQLGSVYTRIPNDTKLGILGSVMAAEDIARISRVGLYVASEKEQPQSSDIYGIGLVGTNSAGEFVASTLLSADQLRGMGEDSRRRLGNLVDMIASRASIAARV